MNNENQNLNEFQVEELEQRLEMRGWGNSDPCPGKGPCDIDF